MEVHCETKQNKIHPNPIIHQKYTNTTRSPNKPTSNIHRSFWCSLSFVIDTPNHIHPPPLVQVHLPVLGRALKSAVDELCSVEGLAKMEATDQAKNLRCLQKVTYSRKKDQASWWSFCIFWIMTGQGVGTQPGPDPLSQKQHHGPPGPIDCRRLRLANASYRVMKKDCMAQRQRGTKDRKDCMDLSIPKTKDCLNTDCLAV